MLTSRDLQVKDHEVQDAPGGGKRAVYHLVLQNSPQEKTGPEATLTYELAALKEMLVFFETELMTGYEVSSMVNSPRKYTPACAQ